MKLFENRGRFEVSCVFAEKDIPKTAKFRWDPENKVWWTDDLKNASKLSQFAEGSLCDRLSVIKEDYESALKESHALRDDLNIPVPENLSYIPYQKAGIGFSVRRSAILLADDMGLGKTIQAIGTINAESTIKKVLVICPASLKINWKKEMTKWLTRQFSIGIAVSREEFPTTDIVIINYDIVKKFSNEVRNFVWDLVVFDEGHYLKNRNTQRTKHVVGYYEKKNSPNNIEPIKARKKMILTGTPIPNRIVELWPLLNYLDPENWGNYSYFTKRYCGAHHNGWGWDVGGATNLDELQEKLRTTVMIRRLKKDVLTDLPPKRRQIIEIEDENSSKIVERERKVSEKYQDRLEELAVQNELANVSEFDDGYLSKVNELSELLKLDFEEISRLRHDTALQKIPYCMEYIHDAIESSGKVVIFAHHHDVVDAITENLDSNKIKYVLCTGKTSQIDRDHAVESFQNDPGVKVFIGTIKAAGVGITLTAASHVIFVELDWVPGNVTQAEDRLHRIGQKNSVLVQHLVLNDSLDANLAKKIISKQTVIEGALNNLHYLHTFVLPEVSKKDDHVSSTRSEIKKQAEMITIQEIESIHNALRYLSSVCDGARQEDTMGFNRIDVGIGKSLAACNKLTPAQAVLGRKICAKYHRQLPEKLYKSIFQ